MKQIVRLGSRDSALAVAQTKLVLDVLQAAHPELQLELLTMKTTGDLILNKALDQIGGKGLFVKELDSALRERRVDITVHSLKDMPMEPAADLPLLAFFQRGDARDALVLPAGKTAPEADKPIGCGSARRVLQLKALYPAATVKLVRGNVLTRLAKLDSGEYSALVLAAAGLRRLGLENRISRVFTPQEMLPAAGQGILVLQGRAGEDYSYLSCVSDYAATVCATAERSFVRTLDGGCSSPIAAYAQLAGETVTLTGLYYDEALRRHLTGTAAGAAAHARELGEALALRLKEEVRR